MVSRLQKAVITLLRWSEKYTKTDMVYLAHGGFWSVVGQGTAVISSLALAVIVSRFLPKDAYGEYKYIISIVGILSAFTLSGVGSAVFQSVAHKFDGALQEGFWMNLRWSIFMFIGSLGLSAYYFIFHNNELAFGILIGGSLSPLLASANLSSSFLGAKKDFARQTIYFDVIANFVPVTSLVVTIFLTHEPLALVAVYFASNTLIALYLYMRTLHIYRPDAQATDPGMLLYGKHLSFMGILAGLAGNIDQILLFHFVGPVQLAIYNFATAIPDQVKGPLKMFDSMVQARFAGRTDIEIRRGMRHKIILLSIFYALATGAYIAVAPFIYRIFFPNYTDAVFYSQIYALSMLIFPLGISNSYFAVKKKVREQYVVTVASSIFQIITMVIGVIWWGLLGLVAARIVSRLFIGGISLLLFRYSREK